MVARLDVIVSGVLFLAGGYALEMSSASEPDQIRSGGYGTPVPECVVPNEAIGDWALDMPSETSDHVAHLIIYCDGRYVDFVTAPILETGGEILPDCAYLAELSGGRLQASPDRISFSKDVSGRELPECGAELERSYIALHEPDEAWSVSLQTDGNAMILSSADLSMRFERVQ